jgi:DNA-binding GntR family transcriptional regulator
VAVAPTVSTKADDIALAIEEAIVSGHIQPGTVLRQEQLSEQFNVSRTPIREALRKVAALGLVSFVPNRGVRVRTVAADELREAFLVRAELESLATELAAPRMTKRDLEELDAVEEEFTRLTHLLRTRKDADDRFALTSDWVRTNHAFHDVIYRVADHPYLESVAKSARRTFTSRWAWAPGVPEIDELYAANDRQHRAIREALAAGSAAGARALAREHVLASFNLLRTILEHVGSQPREKARRSA